MTEKTVSKSLSPEESTPPVATETPAPKPRDILSVEARDKAASKPKPRSASRKSAFTSTNKPRSFKRKRTFQRGCEIQPLDLENETHLFYLFAAYKRGYLPVFAENLDRAGFVAELVQRVVMARQVGDCTILVGRTERKDAPYGDMIPVGFVVMDVYQNLAWPHVVWFPEASTRNKVECALKYLVYLKESHKGIIVCNGRDVPFFSHLNKYGVIRQVGKLRGYYDGEDGFLFETVG